MSLNHLDKDKCTCWKRTGGGKASAWLEAWHWPPPPITFKLSFTILGRQKIKYKILMVEVVVWQGRDPAHLSACAPPKFNKGIRICYNVAFVVLHNIIIRS